MPNDLITNDFLPNGLPYIFFVSIDLLIDWPNGTIETIEQLTESNNGQNLNK